MGLTLEQALMQVFNFLSQNPREFVILQFKVDDGSDDVSKHKKLCIHDEVNKVLRKEPFVQRLYAEDKIPTVGEARGRMIYWHRWNRSPGAMVWWPDRADNFGSSATACPADHQLFVSDLYNWSIDAKKSSLETWLNWARKVYQDGFKNCIILTYCSTSTGDKGCDWEPWRSAAKINPFVHDYFRKQTSKHFGIVIMDFVTPELAKDIWMLNFSPANDYDGDGLADPIVYEEATGKWKIRLSSADYYLIVTTFNGLGGPGYASVPADYDGDGQADPAVYQETTGIWIILPSRLNYEVPVALAQPLGGPGCSGIPADYDGDQLADPGVYYRTSGDWEVLFSSANYYPVNFAGLLGGTGYSAVAEDYDGDLKADPAIYGEKSGYWIFKLSSIGYVEIALAQTLGGAGYVPVPADYDGDGKADPAVRSETSTEWIVMFSTGGYMPVSLSIVFE